MPGLQLFISDWMLMHNLERGKDEEITGMNLRISAIRTCTDILESITTEEIRHVTQEDYHISHLTPYMIYGYLSTKAEVKKSYNHTGH